MNRILPLLFCFAVFFLSAQTDGLTYVPDDNFERKLISLGYDDAFDNYVRTDNIENVQEISFYFNGFNAIYDLTGIEAFTSLKVLRISKFSLSSATIDPEDIKEIVATKLNLEVLDLSGYEIKTLDLSHHEQLRKFFCSNCNLEELDISTNLLLEELNLYNNNLSTLDISKNENLEVLSASLNRFKEFDASTNPNLTSVRLLSNELESVTVKNGNNAILKYFTVYNNYYLQCIEIDDTNAIGEFWGKDIQANYATDCSGPLEDIDADDDGILDIFDVCPDTPIGEEVSQKGCSISQLSHLPLEYLNLSIGSEPCWESTRNGFVEISMKEELNLPPSSIPFVQVNLTKDDQTLDLGGIYSHTSYSHRGLPEGNYTVCLSKEYRGELCLDVSFSANSNVISTSLAIQKPNSVYTMTVAGSTTYVVQVNDQSYSYEFDNPEEQQIDIPFDVGLNDISITGIRDCEVYNPDLTFVPDDNFEQHFIDLGYDDVLDNYVITELLQEIEQIAPRRPVFDLTGIADMNNLTTIVIYDYGSEGIAEIDLSVRPNLEILRVESGSLKNIDLSNNLMLKTLIIENGVLENIDLSNNPNLEVVRLSNNKLNWIHWTKLTPSKAIIFAIVYYCRSV